MPMFVADQESGRQYLTLKSANQYKDSPFLALSFPTTTISLWNIRFLRQFSNLWHYFENFWETKSVQTIRFPPERSRNGWGVSQNRIYFSSILILTILLSNLVPTAGAVGLGLRRQHQSSNQRQPQASPFYDPSRAGVESVPSVDDSTIVIRTIETPSLVQQPAQVFGGPPPYQYNGPPVNTPVYYPNYYNYPVFGSSWGYPDTRLVGNYGPYNSMRNPQQNRQKSGNRRRKDRQRAGKCPKICDTCIRTHENGKVNEELQRRFALHVKPSLNGKDSAEALFKYVDGNNDGSISLTELQNYLLLHNIIPPEVPK